MTPLALTTESDAAPVATAAPERRAAPCRVLMLAYFFPPDSSGGVPRTVQFIKYLPQFGWRADVVAPNWEIKAGRDVGFGADLPAATQVFRAGTAGQDEWPWRMLNRIPKMWRLLPTLRSMVQYPDRCAAWGRAALEQARTLVQSGQYYAIYSTSPPVTSHYVALKLKEEFGIPWIADFRDPWTDSELGYLNPWKWRKRIDQRLERRFYATADAVIANTASNRQTIVSRHGVPEEKVVTITNGYDEADFAEGQAEPPTDRFRIVYAGCSYLSYNPGGFLGAFKSFLEREPNAKAVLALAGEASGWAEKAVNDPVLREHLELCGHVSRREISKLLTGSHVLLHVYPPGIPYSVPGKIYEYLRAGRPIVAICDRPSEVASLLERTGRGRAFRPDETTELSSHLAELYGCWSATRCATAFECSQEVRRYDRQDLCARLAETFHSVVAK